MLVNAITYTFPVERADEVERILRELRAASLREEGCQGFDVCRVGDEAPGMFVLYERWNDQAALDAHYATEHFARLGTNGIRPLATSRQAFKGKPVE
ncbi:MAG TPA: putative quinol monooxygenase [Candidatus Elarobacter sp.]|jgi:quinol monooxygenase YgiN|nr:putative quinol monooxygenase [Candidatus Elarobacter sp.]